MTTEGGETGRREEGEREGRRWEEGAREWRRWEEGWRGVQNLFLGRWRRQ